MTAPHIAYASAQAVDHGLKILIHGFAGAGKTRLCATTGDIEHTLLVSAEAGLLSLRDCPIPTVTVRTLADLQGLYRWLVHERPAYRWLCLDSLSEIAEVVLASEKAQTKDPRQAYGALQDRMLALVKTFRDLPGYHVVMTCKSERIKDDLTGSFLTTPLLPGQKLAQHIPYLFDEVLYLRVFQTADPDGQPVITRALQTQRDAQIEAKDRSGALDFYAPADLAQIAARILGEAAPSAPVNEGIGPGETALEALEPVLADADDLT